jgi:hypothetical protein
MPVPPLPKAYHITHIDNLALILGQGVIWSDRKRLDLGLDCAVVGMSKIKQRRLEELVVRCHPPTRVGEYVPFYFCPRSIMLYILWKGNHPEVTYRGGQESIVHLVADVRSAAAWAQREGRRWAFSDRNAGAAYAEFFQDLRHLNHVDWDAVENHDFRTEKVKDGKQAEFLVYESFPWTLVERIGVHNDVVREQVRGIIGRDPHQPPVETERGWYY